MANYNSRINYNEGLRGNGANYNSSNVFLVEVQDVGTAEELISIAASMVVSDSGIATDSAADVIQYTTDKYLVVTTEGRLEPLGVIVLSDSRKDLMPETRDYSEEIPGRHGEIDFATEFKARIIELHVATDEGLSPLQKERLKRKIAMYLNPVNGTKKLVFLDDPEVEYEVKYVGRIDPTNYPTWLEFTIPFKMHNPIISAANEKTQTGSGIITNEGTFETGLVIEIAGAVTNPTIVIGSDTLKYTGNISAGQTLVIDTEKMTAKIGSTNVLMNYNGVFPKLPPGSLNVTAGSNVTIRWKDKYI